MQAPVYSPQGKKPIAAQILKKIHLSALVRVQDVDEYWYWCGNTNPSAPRLSYASFVL